MKEIFENHWRNLNNNLKSKIMVVYDHKLKNNINADVALFDEKDCLAIGKYVEKIISPDDENLRRYFHGAYGLIGCGTYSKLWFYFDDENIIINDHKYVYPYDEMVKDLNELIERANENEH